VASLELCPFFFDGAARKALDYLSPPPLAERDRVGSTLDVASGGRKGGNLTMPFERPDLRREGGGGRRASSAIGGTTPGKESA